MTAISATPKTYSINSMVYSLPRLLMVSALMIVTNLALSLVCYQVVPKVKPILLDSCGATATDIALIIGSIPQLINFILCPLISTCSDRTRTRFGRRTPYLIITAPLMSGLLLMLGWFKEIAALLVQCFPALEGTNVPLYCLAALILLFQVLYLFPGSVYYYLIADVIPRECIGRYMAVSSCCNSILGAAFNFFLLDKVLGNIKPAFCIIAAAYLLIYILQMIFVKEGEYPPVEKRPKNEKFLKSTAAYLVMFFRQCFGHKIFILLFLASGLNQASNICRNMFNILFATKEIGVTIAEYGKIAGISGLIAAGVVLIAGKLIDKYHPMAIYFYAGIFIMIVNVFGYFFVYSVATFAVIGIATTLMYAIQGLADSPLMIAILPPDKYGQFCSANSMVNSVVVLVGAWLGGYMTDLFGYRVMFVWDFCVTLIATLAVAGVYLQWKRLGGKANYVPPQV